MQTVFLYTDVEMIKRSNPFLSYKFEKKRTIPKEQVVFVAEKGIL